MGSEFQSIESSASQGVIENLANFDSTSWLNSESDANSAKRLSNINKLKSLKSLLGSRSMESLTGHLSTAGATDNEIRKHNFTASVDSIDGKATAREEPDQSDDVVDWSQDPWGGFTDSVVTEGCEAGGSGAPASKTEHPARRDVVIAPVRVVGGRGKGGSLGSTRVRPSFASRADATRR